MRQAPCVTLRAVGSGALGSVHLGVTHGPVSSSLLQGRFSKDGRRTKKNKQLNLCRVSKSLSSVPPSSSSLRDSHFIKSTCHSAQGRGNWHTHKAAQPPPLLRVKTSSLSRSLTPVSLREATLQPYGPQPARLLCPWDSPSENTGAGCHCLLRVIFPTQGWKPCILCLCVGSWVLCR